MQIGRVCADILKETQQKYHPGGAQRGSAGQRGAGLVVQLKESREVSGELLRLSQPFLINNLSQSQKIMEKKNTFLREMERAWQVIHTVQSVPLVTYLDLSVVANGFDGRGVSQDGVCAAWTELDHSLGPAHQAGHSAAVFDQLLLLLLREISPHAQSI